MMIQTGRENAWGNGRYSPSHRLLFIIDLYTHQMKGEAE